MVRKRAGFTYDDGVDLRDLLEAQVENLKDTVKLHDENYKQMFDNLHRTTDIRTG
jgi:hypothetical protein